MKYREPIPANIMVKVALLPEDLTPTEYREAVKKIARENPPYHGSFLFEVYDDELSALIREATKDN